MAATKHFTREEILMALRNTKSVTAAARYVGCHYTHFKVFARAYRTDDGKQSLLEAFKNQSGKNISKNGRKTYGDNMISTEDILSGKALINNFTYEQIKNRIIRDKIIVPKCSVCGFCEKREDREYPLVLNFKDGNIKNFRKENLELLCYNHYFMAYKKLIVNEEHIPGFNTFNPEYDINGYIDYGDDVQYFNFNDEN